jgi:hypothetical protein
MKAKAIRKGPGSRTGNITRRANKGIAAGEAAARQTARGSVESGTSRALWKTIGARMQLTDLTMHLQGLYAELGKAVFEAREAGRRPSAGRSSDTRELLARIAEMRKRQARLEAAAGARAAVLRGKGRS